MDRAAIRVHESQGAESNGTKLEAMGGDRRRGLRQHRGDRIPRGRSGRAATAGPDCRSDGRGGGRRFHADSRGGDANRRAHGDPGSGHRNSGSTNSDLGSTDSHTGTPHGDPSTSHVDPRAGDSNPCARPTYGDARSRGANGDAGSRIADGDAASCTDGHAPTGRAHGNTRTGTGRVCKLRCSSCCRRRTDFSRRSGLFEQPGPRR